MKLKTLNELTRTKRGRRREDSDSTMFYDVIQIGETVDYAYPCQLREEAIKWIKELKQSCIDDEHDPNECLYCGCKDDLIDWIKTFFNISDEDLKSKEE